MPTAAPMTAEELLRLNVQDKRTELVKGRLVVRKPAGYQHGQVAMQSAVAISNPSAGIGSVRASPPRPASHSAPQPRYGARGRRGLHCDGPAAAFETRGFPELAPDLVVEVLSPDDRPGEVLAKVADWLNAGCRLVWVDRPHAPYRLRVSGRWSHRAPG
ncbi:MAG: Uma2 family endonuclease [Gemmatimonadetes bacterium]|nr:Uma2 family endonuclease [Gemmatimonadota bacterium]